MRVPQVLIAHAVKSLMFRQLASHALTAPHCAAPWGRPSRSHSTDEADGTDALGPWGRPSRSHSTDEADGTDVLGPWGRPSRSHPILGSHSSRSRHSSRRQRTRQPGGLDETDVLSSCLRGIAPVHAHVAPEPSRSTYNWRSGQTCRLGYGLNASLIAGATSSGLPSGLTKPTKPTSSGQPSGFRFVVPEHKRTPGLVAAQAGAECMLRCASPTLAAGFLLAYLLACLLTYLLACLLYLLSRLVNAGRWLLEPNIT